MQRVESPLSHEGSSRNRSIDPIAVHHKLDITKVPESIFVKFSIDSPVSLVARHSGTLDASIHRSNKGCFAGLTTDLVIDSSSVSGRVKKLENFHIIIFMQIFIQYFSLSTNNIHFMDYFLLLRMTLGRQLDY